MFIELKDCKKNLRRLRRNLRGSKESQRNLKESTAFQCVLVWAYKILEKFFKKC